MAKPDEKEGGNNDAPKAGGGIKDWLPLIVTMTVMPIIAYALTSFVLVPQLQAKLGAEGSDHAEDDAHSEGHAEAKPSAHGKSSGHGSSGGHGGGEGEAGSNMATVKKVLVNVKGTSATQIGRAHV